MNFKTIGLCALTLSLLTGCQKSNHVSTDAPHMVDVAKADTVGTTSAEERAYQEYLTAENRINSGIVVAGPLSEQLESYKKQDVATLSAPPSAPLSTYFRLGTLEHALKHLKDGGAVKLTGEYASVDQAARTLSEKTEAFRKTLSTMDNYLASASVNRESFEKAKELDPTFTADATAFVDAYKAFSEALSKAEIYRSGQIAQKAKESGDIRRALAYSSYRNVQKFRNILSTTEEVDTETAKKLEEEINAMQSSLSDLSHKNDEIIDIKSAKYASAQDELKGLLSIMNEAGHNKFERWYVGQFNRQYNQFVRNVVDAGVLD